MEEISFETACELGLIKRDALDYAYHSVEGCSILSKATDIQFEQAYRNRMTELRRIKYVNFEGKTLRIV